jgi:hypothetical protein
MSPAANSGATSTATTRVVVPAARATELTTLATLNALGTGDMLENKELCRKKIYSELNLDVR